MSPNAVATNGRTGKRRRTQRYQNLNWLADGTLQTLHHYMLGSFFDTDPNNALLQGKSLKFTNLMLFHDACFTRVNFKEHIWYCHVLAKVFRSQTLKVSNFWVFYFLKTLKSTQKVKLVLIFAMTSNIPWRIHGPRYIYLRRWKPSFMKRSCR